MNSSGLVTSAQAVQASLAGVTTGYNVSDVSNGVTYSGCTCQTTYTLAGVTPPPCPVHPAPPAPSATPSIQKILDQLAADLQPDAIDYMTDDEIFAELREMIAETGDTNAAS